MLSAVMPTDSSISSETAGSGSNQLTSRSVFVV